MTSAEHDPAPATDDSKHALLNDFLATYLDDIDDGHERSLADYQAMFPGREEDVAAEISCLLAKDETETLVCQAPALPDIPDVKLTKQIGRGGQGIVYRGRQEFLDRQVAVKVLAPAIQTPGFGDRFRREAKILAALRHPNIVTCFHAGTLADGRGYMVMEFVDGPNLRGFLNDHGPMAQNDALGICGDLARALEHAHQSGIIHRDVKPENVLLHPKPQAEGDSFPYEVKLADLGLARTASKLVGGVTQTNLTPDGVVFGSPMTMAPEQFDDPDAVDFRADIYALGCVLFHALAGVPAFRGKTFTAAIVEKIKSPVPDIREIRKDDVTPGVASLLTSMLAPSRDDRPGSHDEVATRCDQLRSELAGKSGRRRRSALAIAAVFVVVLVAVLGVFNGWFDRGNSRPLTVKIVATANVIEGAEVSLSAMGSEEDVTYHWEQTDEGYPVRLSDPHAAETTFTAPRGPGPIELHFRVSVSNGEQTRAKATSIRVAGDPRTQPLRPGQRIDLFRSNTELGKAVEDWQKPQGDTGTWGTPQNDHLAGARPGCSGTTRRWRHLPRGHFVLAGKIAPRLWKKDRPLESVGLRLETCDGHALVLDLRPATGSSYQAGLSRARIGDDDTANVIENVARTTPAPFGPQRPLRFSLRWNGTVLQAAWGTDESNADWQIKTIRTSEWTPYPPCRLTIFLRSGRACFCELSLRGLK